MVAIYFKKGSAVFNCFLSYQKNSWFQIYPLTECDISNILLNSDILSTTIIINTYYVEVIFVTSLRDCHFLSFPL